MKTSWNAKLVNSKKSYSKHTLLSTATATKLLQHYLTKTLMLYFTDQGNTYVLIDWPPISYCFQFQVLLHVAFSGVPIASGKCLKVYSGGIQLSRQTIIISILNRVSSCQRKSLIIANVCLKIVLFVTNIGDIN